MYKVILLLVLSVGGLLYSRTYKDVEKRIPYTVIDRVVDSTAFGNDYYIVIRDDNNKFHKIYGTEAYYSHSDEGIVYCKNKVDYSFVRCFGQIFFSISIIVLTLRLFCYYMDREYLKT